MIKITFPDGSVKEFKNPITPLEIANSIGLKISNQPSFAIVNGVEFDITAPITENAKLEIITIKNEEKILPFIRHDLAHVLGEAVLELFPETKLATGPATENGFFYDFLTPHTFSTEDLEVIQNKMLEIINRAEDVEREVWNKSDAIDYFSKNNDVLKLEILKEIKDDTVTIYKHKYGTFLDLCRGPHAQNTSLVTKAFKLVRVSSVYWKGNKNSYSLQRIYGIGFLNNKDLKAYENLYEEALKRDHRKLGKEMQLFHLQDEAAGSVFWHENGWRLYKTIEEYMRKKLKEYDYIEVKTPQILSRTLWEKSGHWEKFKDDMFIIANSDEDLAIKPMNCPCHIEIFKQGLKSYKDLPIRMAEFGSCHRNEPSGALHGIMRVRAFTQDDAHIFCTEEQIFDEIKKFTEMLKQVYKDILGDVEIFVKFSTRPEKRAGTDEIWDKAESTLYKAAESSGLEVILNEGEGAFYGPKLEFTLKDSLGRGWQVGTMQLDFVLPERLGATYIGADGNKHIPILLHRAILGSFERFIGILIEHYAGKFPLWLAPVQVAIATITSDATEYAESIANKLKSLNLNTKLDVRNEKIGYKIREHSNMKVPIIMVIGKKEVQEGNVVLRFLGSNNQKEFKLQEAIDYITNNAKMIINS